MVFRMRLILQRNTIWESGCVCVCVWRGLKVVTFNSILVSCGYCNKLSLKIEIDSLTARPQ